MINAQPLDPSGRDGQIESIGRISPDGDTDDLSGGGAIYGGDTTEKGYATYPDIWLRIQRQGDKFMSYFANTHPTDFPAGSNPGGTNGQRMAVARNRPGREDSDTAINGLAVTGGQNNKQ